MLQNRHSQHQIELFPQLKMREVRDRKTTVLPDALFGRAPARLGDHRRAQVDAQHEGAARRQESAPAPDAATDIQNAGVLLDFEPRRKRQALFEVDGAIVEFRHAIRADGGESVALTGKSLRSIFPIVRRRILMGGGHTADGHRISPIFSAPKFWPTGFS